MPGRSHFNLFNKDTRELFMLWILCFVPVINSLLLFVIYLFVLVIHYCCSFICSLFKFSSMFLFNFILLRFFCFHYSLCIVQREKIQFNSDPGRCSRYFDPVQVNLCTTSSMRVNNHTADFSDFVLV